MILATSYSGATANAIGSLVVTTTNRVHVVTEDQEGFAKVLAHLKAGENDEAERILDRLSLVRSAVVGSRFAIVGNVVSFDGRSLPMVMAQYVMRLHTEGFDLTALERFAENLFQNPSFRAINEAFFFIESNQMPITEDGCFIGYRAVTSDYTDIRTNTFDNSIGKVCEEPRNMVDEDPNNTCSNGLHVCSLGYINGMGAGYGSQDSPWMIVKVNPRDVVAVPRDYHNTKMRVCRFEVIGELDKSLITPTDKKSYREDNAVFQSIDQELISSSKFKELGEKHFKKNESRGSGNPLTPSSFNSVESYDQYLAGYEGRDLNDCDTTVGTGIAMVSNKIPTLGSHAAIARQMFDDSRFTDLISFKKSKRLGLGRLGFTSAEQALIETNRNVNGLPSSNISSNVSDSTLYDIGYQDGKIATSFKPKQINPQYWSGYSAAWLTNPNKP